MKTVYKPLIYLALLAAPTVSFGTVVIAPNSNTSSPGNASSNVPTATGNYEIQEDVGSGQFPSVPIQITSIAFRAVPGGKPVRGTVGTLSVYLSTSPNFPNTSGGGKTLMSPTFANNVGSDQKLVYSSPNVVLTDSGCVAGPCPFDINIPLSTPFTYNSANGTLLIDIQETNLTGGSGSYDAESFTTPGGSVAQVAGTLGNPSGTFSYQGNIVQITYTTTFPTFSGVVNAGSGTPPGLPNYGIAQGAVFTAYGANFGAAPPAGSYVNAGTFPLSTNLAGTSITVTVNGTTVSAPMIFTNPGQVAAVMPSNAPVGSGTMTLNYNGMSGSTPVTVTQSAFGISNTYLVNTNNGVGLGQIGIATFGNNQTEVVTNTDTAAPGDTLVLWGTGLGATTVAGDSQGAPFGNIGSQPLVFVGGVQSPSLTYWGRAPGAAGLDQIDFVVPQNAPLGCNVGIVVETMNGNTPIVSNGPTISLAATDHATCSDPTQLFPSSLTSTTKSSVKGIIVGVQQNVSVSPGSNGTVTSSTSSGAQVLLGQFSQAQLAADTTEFLGANYQPSFGSCYTGFASTSGGGSGPLNATNLNAGPSITLTPPSGSAIMLTQSGGHYQSAGSSNALPSGTWTFSDGSGGPDVGPLSFSFSVPQQITWTNEKALTNGTIPRSSPLTITWSGGDANGYVDIQGYGVNTSGTFDIGFECTAPTSAGQFTIPASILLAMPAGASAFASLQVSTYTIPSSLGAVAGFDLSEGLSQFQTNVPVIFQ